MIDSTLYIFADAQQRNHMNTISSNEELLFRIDNLSDDILNNLTHQTDQLTIRHQLSTLTYTIVFGFVCACLCLLTITGNLLVLITFRRMRTVSTMSKSQKNVIRLSMRADD